MKTAYIVAGDNRVINLMKSVGFDITEGLSKADVVVFGGGADIAPEFYGEKPNPSVRCYYSASEDIRDKGAWDKCKPNQFKVGICRGGQFLNAMSGGKMYQHVAGHTDPHTLFDALWGTSFLATSSHHQQMIPSEEGVIIAYAQGVGKGFHKDLPNEEPPPEVETEVVYYPKTKSLCYQGHPEWAKIASMEFKYYRKLMSEFVHNA